MPLPRDMGGGTLRTLLRDLRAIPAITLCDRSLLLLEAPGSSDDLLHLCRVAHWALLEIPVGGCTAWGVFLSRDISDRIRDGPLVVGRLVHHRFEFCIIN